MGTRKNTAAGVPGEGAGRKDEVGYSGVYPMSGPHPKGEAPVVTPASWGQGKRGAAGYEDHGESELTIFNVAPEKCRDIMTKDPICCLASDRAIVAAQLMKENDVGVLPVVSNQQNKTLVGIVTDRDLALKGIAEKHGRPVIVGEIMTRKVVTCSPDDNYQKALELMERHRLRRIPEVDNSGRVVGIISQADVALRIRDSRETAEVVTEISRPAHAG
jgi:CBS domain-containing protein